MNILKLREQRSRPLISYRDQSTIKFWLKRIKNVRYNNNNNTGANAEN